MNIIMINKIREQYMDLPKHLKCKLAGFLKHREIEMFMICKLIKKNYSVYTEQGIYFKKLKKAYKVDIFANNKKKDIVVECGTCSKSKINDLSKHFKVLHVSYSKFRILKQGGKPAEEILNNIEEVMSSA